MQRRAGTATRIFAAAHRISMLVLLSGTLSGCERGLLNPAGPVSGAERVIMLDSLAIMLAIVVPTIRLHTGVRLVVSRHESARGLRPAVGVLRSTRASGLVDSGARHPVSRRHRLDRLP